MLPLRKMHRAGVRSGPEGRGWREVPGQRQQSAAGSAAGPTPLCPSKSAQPACAPKHQPERQNTRLEAKRPSRPLSRVERNRKTPHQRNTQCPFLSTFRRFNRQTEAPSKVDRALRVFESPRGALSHSKPAGRDAFNTCDVAAERDINPDSLGLLRGFC